jgi:phage tail sheath protein FI
MTAETGPIVWGARTIQGASGSDSDWKYVNVRRLSLFLERSLDRGLQWAASEPNDEALWAEVRPVAGRFLEATWRQGAFAGRTADEAYIVRCGRDTMTEEDVEGGHLNVLVGFAPIRPAEFAWIHLTKELRTPAP